MDFAALMDAHAKHGGINHPRSDCKLCWRYLRQNSRQQRLAEQESVAAEQAAQTGGTWVANGQLFVEGVNTPPGLPMPQAATASTSSSAAYTSASAGTSSSANTAGSSAAGTGDDGNAAQGYAEQPVSER